MTRIRSIRVMAAVVLVLLAGCASTEVLFEKSGVTLADKERDQGVCLRQSIGMSEDGQILLPYTVDRETFNRCMEARGYTVKSL